MPYGQCDGAVLRRRLERIFEFLFDRGANKIAIACNAANAAYGDTEHIVGIVASGVAELAGGRWRRVGLLAGRGTVRSGICAKALASAPIELTQRIAQPLSAHVEAGRHGGDLLHNDLKKILGPLRQADAILLACTHYAAIESAIRQHVAGHCDLIDPAKRMAEWIARNWRFDDRREDDQFFTTGDAAQFKTSAQLAFGVDPATVARANL